MILCSYRVGVGVGVGVGMVDNTGGMKEGQIVKEKHTRGKEVWLLRVPRGVVLLDGDGGELRTQMQLGGQAYSVEEETEHDKDMGLLVRTKHGSRWIRPFRRTLTLQRRVEMPGAPDPHPARSRVPQPPELRRR